MKQQNQNIIDNLIQEFNQIYGQGQQPPQIYFSPGRVNLIGEHTDYNGGYVFPCAIDQGSYIAIRKTNDGIIKLQSQLFQGKLEQNLSNNLQKQQDKDQFWTNYVLGVIQEFLNEKIEILGFELLTTGNLPTGAGLSSSASLEVGISVALNEIFNQNKFSRQELVKISQKAERNFVGVNCGIMDQFAVGMGQKNHAISLKCNENLDYQKVPLNLGNYQIVVSNTNKQRGLADSKYNERVEECQKGLNKINELLKKDYKNLTQVSLQEFQSIQQSEINEEFKLIFKRCFHVISENERVLQAVQCLNSNNLEKFGQLMNESHNSLQQDYEVTGIELDVLVGEARKIDGVLGSRMTGAGFGGCTVSLVEKNKIDEFKNTVGQSYEKQTGLKAEFYVFGISDGAKNINQKQQIIVTGGTGYIGSHTVVELIESGYEPIIIDNLYNSQIDVLDGIQEITGVKPIFENVDLKDYEKTNQVFKKYNNIKGVIHFAAYKAIGESFQNPLKYYENNINSLISVMKAMKNNNIDNLVFSSSCAVYGKSKQLPVTEESPFLPAESPYGNTKQIGEQMLQNFSRSENKTILSLRYFNPIGAHDSLKIGELPIGVPLNLVPYVTQTAYGIREQLNVFGGDWETPDGSCIRDYLHVVDLAKAHIKGLQRILNNQQEKKYEYFNLGTGKGYSVLEIIKCFEKVTNIKINYKIIDRRQGDIAEIWADNKLGQKVLDWKCEKSLEEMLLSAWQWEKTYRDSQQKK